MLTALSATTANAIVIETDGSVGARLVGAPREHQRAPAPAMMKPLITQRTIWARVTILDAGLCAAAAA